MRFILILVLLAHTALARAQDVIRVSPRSYEEQVPSTPLIAEENSLSSGWFKFIPNAQNMTTFTDCARRALPISILKISQAKKLFDHLKKVSRIPYRYPQDGCYARAEEMAILMEQLGVTPGKVFIHGDLQVETPNAPAGFVQWNYHVAPIVMVKLNGTDVPHVFDPSIFDEPVPYKEWEAIQTIKGKKLKQYYTSPYQFAPGCDVTLKGYKTDEISMGREHLNAFGARIKDRDTRKIPKSD